jgi:hypothetical protein
MSMDASYLKLDLPLPICGFQQRMLDNIDVILSDFEELEVKHYGRSSAPVEVKIEPSDEASEPPAKKLRQCTLF